MATYRVRLKRPIWDNITPITSTCTFTYYTSTGGTPIGVSDSAYTIQNALAIVANITNKEISINNLSVIGQTALPGTMYAMQNGPTLSSPSLCFIYNEVLGVIRLKIDGCGE